jgi:hypothetical protein
MYLLFLGIVIVTIITAIITAIVVVISVNLLGVLTIRGFVLAIQRSAHTQPAYSEAQGLSHPKSPD